MWSTESAPTYATSAEPLETDDAYHYHVLVPNGPNQIVELADRLGIDIIATSNHYQYHVARAGHCDVFDVAEPPGLAVDRA